MIKGKDIFQIWAPDNSIWSAWVSPSLFAQIECSGSSPLTYANVPPLSWTERAAETHSAVVVDLPGAESIRFGIASAKRGFRPVLINNASPGPCRPGEFLGSPSMTTFNLLALANEICAASDALKGFDLPADSPPAFILDSKRLMKDQPLHKEIFDNRWMVFPQDFPTAGFMTGRGIKRVILLQVEGSQPQSDLRDVLLEWQRGGMEIFRKEAASKDPPSKVTISGPNRLVAFLENMLTSLGFGQGNVGGFGSSVGDFMRVG